MTSTGTKHQSRDDHCDAERDDDEDDCEEEINDFTESTPAGRLRRAFCGGCLGMMHDGKGDSFRV